jgi:hypothetical protein
VRYRSPEEDSGRWEGFPFRDGDIVISTRSKHGTTWMQMICALLVFRSPELPAPLSELSPWFDWLVERRPDVLARLEAQRHRRFIKTHTPLDGLPLDRRATYVVVARHPLDAAVSLYYQGDNLDRRRLRDLTGQPGRASTQGRAPVRDWLVGWIERNADAQDDLDSLPGVLWHVSDAWARRAEPNVVLVHYHDLSTGLESVIGDLAGRLGVTVDDEAWPELVEAARFEHMRSRAAELVPDTLGVLKDRSQFFRQGTSGAGRELLTENEYARYLARTAELAPANLLRWLQRPE